MKTRNLVMVCLLLLSFVSQRLEAQIITLGIKDINNDFSSSVPPEETISYSVFCLGADLRGCKVQWTSLKNSAVYNDGTIRIENTTLILEKWKNVNDNAKLKMKLSSCLNTALNDQERTYDVPIRYIGTPGAVLLNGANNGDLNCGTSPVTLSVSPATNATNYNWNLPSGWCCASNNSSIMVTPSVSGGGTISVTASRNDVSYVPAGRQLNVVRPQPTINSLSVNDFTICSSESISVSASGNTLADQFRWTPNGGVTINGSGSMVQSSGAVNVAATSSGFFTVKAWSSACQSESSTAFAPSVHFGPPSINAAMTGSCSGYTLWLNELAATSYNWYEDPGTANNGYLSTYGGGQASGTPTSGEYIVIGQATNQCGNAGYTFLMYACNGYRVAPNPAKAKINVVFDNTDNIKTLPEQIDVLSENSTNVLRTINVKQVFDKKQFVNGNTVMIDAEGLPRETYYLHVKFGEQTDKKTKIDKLRIILE